MVEFLNRLISSLWVLKVAVASINNTSPVHNPVLWWEANLCNAFFIAFVVNLKSLKVLGVVFSNWLKDFSVVLLDFSFSVIQDFENLLLVSFLVSFELGVSRFNNLWDILNEVKGLVNLLWKIEFESEGGGSSDTEDGKNLSEHLSNYIY